MKIKALHVFFGMKLSYSKYQDVLFKTKNVLRDDKKGGWNVIVFIIISLSVVSEFTFEQYYGYLNYSHNLSTKKLNMRKCKTNFNTINTSTIVTKHNI